MITEKLIVNKIYLYKNILHKVRRIQKSKKRALIQNLMTGEEVFVAIDQHELLLSRVYTIGEVAKIVERRPDTIRKYERKGLIPKPLKIEEDYPSYRNWRFYTGPDVYEMVEFFSDRSPGRPTREKSVEVKDRIKTLNQKVKLTTVA